MRDFTQPEAFHPGTVRLEDWPATGDAGRGRLIVEGFTGGEAVPPDDGIPPAAGQLWPWKSREVSAPPFPRVPGGASGELAREGDYAWVASDLEGYRRTVLLGTPLDSAVYLSRLARIQLLKGEWKAARAAAGAACRRLSSLAGPHSEEALFCEETLALSGFKELGWLRADACLEGVAARAETLGGPDCPQALRSMSSRAALASRAGVRGLSLLLLEELADRDGTVHGAFHRFSIADRISLAIETGLTGGHRRAVGLARRCAEEAAAVLGPKHPLRCVAVAGLGQVKAGAGSCKEAAAILADAVDLHVKVMGPCHPRTLECVAQLSGALWRSGLGDLAERVAAQATMALLSREVAFSPVDGKAWEALDRVSEMMAMAKLKLRVPETGVG
jgi:hypothetical protein